MFSAWDVSAMDHLLDDVMGAPLGAATTTRSLGAPTDIVSSPEDVTFRCDVPGIRAEDLDVTVENRVLTIRGSRKYDAKADSKVVLGRAYGSFSRVFMLPDGLDDASLSAHLQDGVLSVRILKLPKAAPRRITVGAGAPVKDPKR